MWPIKNTTGNMDPYIAFPAAKPGEFARLVELDLAATDDLDVALIEKLADLWMEGKVANQPIRSSRGFLCEVVGRPSYREAKAAWLKEGKRPGRCPATSPFRGGYRRRYRAAAARASSS